MSRSPMRIRPGAYARTTCAPPARSRLNFIRLPYAKGADAVTGPGLLRAIGRAPAPGVPQ
jgi:hypothetical protein